MTQNVLRLTLSSDRKVLNNKNGTPGAFSPKPGTLWGARRNRLHHTREPVISHRNHAHPYVMDLRQPPVKDSLQECFCTSRTAALNISLSPGMVVTEIILVRRQVPKRYTPFRLYLSKSSWVEDTRITGSGLLYYASAHCLGLLHPAPAGSHRPTAGTERSSGGHLCPS